MVSADPAWVKAAALKVGHSFSPYVILGSCSLGHKGNYYEAAALRLS
jgi:hypothetical protein